MPKVNFKNLDKMVEALEGQSILDAALDNDIALTHDCGGNCTCSTCHVVILEGMENLSPKDEAEQDQLEMAEGLTPTSRLSCQSRVFGDVALVIPSNGSSQGLASDPVFKIGTPNG
ncbi:MAG: (2Fe-2S)-binding protein [candidate division Zixibacteria bacterium]|nr:(2Fe-2S)-binding protein [candidate division Zixibacteria bacterium]